VTPVSGAISKNGDVTDGAPVIAQRDEAWLAHQVFDHDLWSVGRYRNASITGARAASPIAAPSALLHHPELNGDTDMTRGPLEASARCRQGCNELP
jgi:hypothetical protein